MANRRMISKTISTSKKLMKISDFAALLFSWIIPHCDDYGHMDGSPEMVRGIVVPLRNKTIEEVKNALQELEGADLIKNYDVKSEKYLEIIKWSEFQTFKNDRPLVMEYPLPLESAGILLENLSDSSKDKLSKDNIPDLVKKPNTGGIKGLDIELIQDEESFPLKVLKRKELMQHKGYDPAQTNQLLKWGEAKLGRRYPKPLKQKAAIASMLASGYPIEEIKAKWAELEESDFWQEKGIDFSIVLSQISKHKPIKKTQFDKWEV